MTGDIRSQISLISVLAEYESAEKWAAFFSGVPELQAQADRLHEKLCVLAMACGFSPGREDHHVATVDWAHQRAEQLARIFPNHIAEANNRRAV
jgi:hypothetical protein